MFRSHGIVKRIFVFGAVLMLAVPTYGDTSYLRSLVDQPSTTFSDGVSIITSFLGKAAENPDFSSQKKFLEDQGILSVRLSDKKGDEILRRSELAEMAVRTLGVEGGLLLRLTGAFSRRGVLGQTVFRRYACNEAVFLKLMKPGDMRAAVTGQELISVVSRMSEYQSEEAG